MTTTNTLHVSMNELLSTLEVFYHKLQSYHWYVKGHAFFTVHAQLESYYDEVQICSESAQAHPKAAISIRNRAMIDKSDLVICCIEHNSGGAYMAVKYAQKLGKPIINLIENNHF